MYLYIKDNTYFQEHKTRTQSYTYKPIKHTTKTSVQGKKKHTPSHTYKQKHTFSYKFVQFQTRRNPKQIHQ
jgi:hypothetical protein